MRLAGCRRDGATGEIGGTPAVEPGDRGGRRREERRRERRGEREVQERRDRGLGECVRGHRQQRDGMELKPQDRCGQEAAGCRDGDRSRELARKRVALEERREARYQDEDGAYSEERELKACVENVIGVPGEQDQCAETQEVPPVGGPSGKPGERPEHACHAGTDHGRLGADSKHVTPDRPDRADLAEPARQPEQPDQHERACSDEGHVLTGNG